MRLGLSAAEAPSRLRLGLELADGDATEDDHERHPRGDEREPDGRQEGLDGHHGGPIRVDEAKPPPVLAAHLRVSGLARRAAAPRPIFPRDE